MAAFDPRDARAVLVGIDEYAAGLGPALTGPADDAVRFAHLLVAHGVPAARITLLVRTRAPLDPPAGVIVRPADRASIRAVFLGELPAQSASWLFVLWGGHGYVDADRRRQLSYGQAHAAETTALDLDALQAAFASDLYPGLPWQLWLVDACQVPEDAPARGAAGREIFPHGAPAPGRVQDVLFAASLGEPAATLRVRRTGVFSREVLALLEPAGLEPAGLEPLRRPEDLLRRLRDRFAALREAGLTRQTPTYFWHRNLRGDEGLVLARPGGRPPAAGHRHLSPAALAPVVDALAEIPEFGRPQEREEILSLLRGPLYGAIRRHPAARMDAFATVRTCLGYAGGLAELVEAVRFFASDERALTRFAEAVADLDPVTAAHEDATGNAPITIE